MRARPISGAVAAGLAVTLAASLGLTTTADAASRGDDKVVASTSAARQALDAARAALHPQGRPTRDATLALRDLVAHRAQLTGADRAAADAILSRPTDPGDDDYYGAGVTVETQCGTYVCMHWVETGEDAADPTYAALTLSTMDAVHATYVAAGYRSPLPDDGQGGSTLPDIYLANIGPEGLYGYCTSDQPTWEDGYALYPYCVLDNDYSPTEFGTANTPTENMQVTAAHEYFHAVQFAYDAIEDGWFMESTATWAEDELFDDVNDNNFYLPYGQLGDAATSLDGFFGLNVYGNWIFIRYLTEAFPAEQGGLPSLVLDFWKRADSTNGEANDYYSLQAIKKVLANQGASLRKKYAAFAADNNHPGTVYEEAETNDEPYPSPAYEFPAVELTPGDPSTGWRSRKIDHLASATGIVMPSSGMTASGWKLKVKVDMAPRKRGSEARVIVYGSSGPQTFAISLNRKGNGAKAVPFSFTDVSGVEIVLVNASDRFTCWENKVFSCQGTPKDDNLKQLVKATAFR